MLRQISYILRILCFSILLVIFVRPPLAESQEAGVFLNPDTTYIIGDGVVFILNIEVDDNTDSLHAYRLNLDFNRNVFDTCFFDTTYIDTIPEPDSLVIDTLYAVYAEEGSLMTSSPYETFFTWNLTSDSSSIFIADALMGPDTYVYGPGVIAKVYFITKGSGESPLIFQNVVLKKAYYDTIPSVSTDGIAYINTPPSSFNLISPDDSAVFKTWEIDSTMLDWEDALTVYPGDSILYTLYYSISENFDPSLTDSVLNINESQYELYVDTFTVPYSLIYWKVKAYNIYGFETWCDPSYLRFAVLPLAPPTNFNLLSPPDSTVIKAFEDTSVILDWDSSVTYYPGDSVLFTLYYSPEENFDLDSTYLVDSLSESEYELSIDTFTQASTPIYWKVRAFDVLLSLETWCAPPYSYFLIVNYICGDVNSDISLSVGDVIYIINYLFKGGPAPYPIEAADVNGDDQITVGDVIYLINYLFKGGSQPDC